MPETNHFGQTVGDRLPYWNGVQPLPHSVLPGQYCRLEPLDARTHTHDLLQAYAQAEDDSGWTWLAGERLTGWRAWRAGSSVKRSTPA